MTQDTSSRTRTDVPYLLSSIKKRKRGEEARLRTETDVSGRGAETRCVLGFIQRIAVCALSLAELTSRMYLSPSQSFNQADSYVWYPDVNAPYSSKTAASMSALTSANHYLHNPTAGAPRPAKRSKRLSPQKLPGSQSHPPPLPPSSPSKPSAAHQHQHLQSSSPRLSECHICYRRPLTRTQLSSFGDCDACARRACYICLRVCETGICGGGGKGRTICSACCVERGVNGTVCCLDCLAATTTTTSTAVKERLGKEKERSGVN